MREVLQSPGQPLDRQTRAFMEPRFGHDFSRVRVHTDRKAAESARAVDALAYTAGAHVVFGPGSYEPQVERGRRLLAHELAHVALQPSAGEPPGELSVAARDDLGELYARRAACGTLRDGASGPLPAQRAPSDRVYRQALPDWQDAGAGRPRPGADVDVERLLTDHPDVATNEILVSIFLAISQREVARVLPSGDLAYSPGQELRIAFSGASSVVRWHCTDLVMNSAWLAGFEVPHGRSFWEKSTATLQRAMTGGDELIQPVPVPADDPRTAADERKQHLRAGDVLVWGAEHGDEGGFGHQMIIVSPGPVGGQVTVREAGAAVREGAQRPLDAPNRPEAVYRFVKFDLLRVSRSYTTDPTYRALFQQAFERCSLPAEVKLSYRR
ncbi:MAG: DUF4157 domain-containing protein [Actinomycetota bacterium]|nr:DUF4157 domain-containing protein [Actinomycetota bacterium]